MCWDEVCRPKELEGLGIANLEVKNRALLNKWIWMFADEKELCGAK